MYLKSSSFHCISTLLRPKTGALREFCKSLNGIAILFPEPSLIRVAPGSFVKAATKACELTAWKDEWNIDALAAAFAEAGDFKQAARYERQAMKLKEANERTEPDMKKPIYTNGSMSEKEISEKRRREMQDRLSIYEHKQAHRQEWRE